jgi:hypothetical protein
MIGAEAFGSTPFSASLSDVPDYATMLLESRTELIYTVELHLRNVSTNGEEVLTLGTSEWATQPDEVPSSTSFRGVLSQPLNFRRSIIGERLGINFESGQGTIVFMNTDGFYDNHIDHYAADGRDVIVRIGRKSDLFADHLVVFRGSAVDWSADHDTVNVAIRDKSFKLDVPAQPATYAGTGGKEGGTDLVGKRKPRCFGSPKGISPLTVDDALLTYQVHYGVLSSIAQVYDRGAALTASANYGTYADLATAVVSPGQYATCLAEGFIRLGSSPAGVILCSAVESASRQTGSVIRDLVLQSHTGLTVDDIDSGSLAAIDLTADNIDYYVDPSESLSVRETVNRLAAVIGAWVGFDRKGILKAKILDAPAGLAYNSIFNYDDGDLIDFNRDKMPTTVWPPPWRWRVANQRSFTTFEDFAGSVSPTIRSFYSQPYRLSEVSSAEILADHPLSIDPPPIESYYSVAADAQAEASRLLAMYSSGYQIYRFTTSRRGLHLEIGDTIMVTHPRFGFDEGGIVSVIEIADRIDLSLGSGVDQVDITVFGRGFMFNDSKFDLDFTRNLGWDGTVSTAASKLLCARGTSGYADDVSGRWHIFTVNTPRITNKGLLIEAATSNLVRNNSMQGAVAHTPILIPPTTSPTPPNFWQLSGDVTSGLAWSVAAVGTDDGYGRDYIDLRLTGTITLAGAAIVLFEPTIAVSPTHKRVSSAWYSLVGGTMNNITSISSIIQQVSGSLFSQTFTLTSTPVRQSLAMTVTSGISAIQAGFRLSFTSGAVDAIVRVAWPQVESGVYPTSPIRSTAGTEVRDNDSISIPNVSWISTQVGTMYIDASASLNSVPGPDVYRLDVGGDFNSAILFDIAAPGLGLSVHVVVGGVYTILTGVAAADNKAALAYQASDLALSINGATPLLDTTVAILPMVNEARVSSLNLMWSGLVRRIAYWQTRYSNNKLMDMTR